MIGTTLQTHYRDNLQQPEIEATSKYMLHTGEADRKRLDIQSALAEAPLMEAMTHWQDEGLLKKDFSGETLLDFGCGTGSLCLYVKKCFPNVKYQGLDIAADSVASAQDAHPDEIFHIGNEYDQYHISGANIIFGRFVVQHQPDPKQFLSDLADSMQSGAKIILFEPYTNRDRISTDLPNALYQTRIKITDYKFELGRIAENQQNFAPQIKDHLITLGLTEVQEYVTKPLIFPLDTLRELLIGSLNSMKDKLILYKIATEEEIEAHITTLRTHENVEGVYLGDTYILLATK